MHVLRVVVAVASAVATGAAAAVGSPAPDPPHPPISDALYASLERYARLVDIAYCIGGGDIEGGLAGGLTTPFSCASRCRDFPEMQLVTTWADGGTTTSGTGGGGGGGMTGRLGHRLRRLLLGDGGCGYVAVDTRAREVVVAFRGTYSLADTVVDLSTVPQAYEPYEPGEADENTGKTTACPNCTVHSGFLAAWRSARGVVLPAVAAAAGLSYNNGPSSTPAATTLPPLPIHLIGHSLGGAVAALAAVEMRAVLGWPAVRVTTYGEPRIGNGALARYVDGVFGDDDNDDDNEDHLPLPLYRRVTHQNDPVPLLPPAEWGYRAHAGELYIATAALPPAPADVRVCRGRADAACLGGGEEVAAADDGKVTVDTADTTDTGDSKTPPALRIPPFLAPSYPWERVFAHRDYFWRLGLCVPGGDPANWGRRLATDEL